MRCKAIHLTGEPFACLVAVCRCVDGCEAQSGEEIGNQRVLAGRDILAKHAARALATRSLDQPVGDLLLHPALQNPAGLQPG